MHYGIKSGPSGQKEKRKADSAANPTLRNIKGSLNRVSTLALLFRSTFTLLKKNI
jgi:hypothetical protein